MARPFSYPEVKALEVGQACDVAGKPSEVARKVRAYQKRAGKHFTVGGFPDEAVTTVIRNPDPEPRAE